MACDEFDVLESMLMYGKIILVRQLLLNITEKWPVAFTLSE
jgi:hypothetical protein